jgi:hypothetical protein
MLYGKKEVTYEERIKFYKEATEECLNVCSDAPVVLQRTDSEIVHMVMHPNIVVHTDGKTDEGTNEELTSGLV